jgi:DNA-directed RNA polymerase subunit RPC12/RpoP
MSDDDELNCPKCGSRRVHAEKRGFNMKRGLALGLTIAPGVGLVSGFVGANKIWLTCLKCGNRFRPGESKEVVEVRLPFEVGSRVRRKVNGPVGEITAIDEGAVTVRWPDNRTTVHLDRDLKPLGSSLE